MKSESTEFRHIVDVVLNYALAFPSTGFLLTHNRKVVLDLANNQTEQQRIKALFSENTFKHLIPIEHEHPYIRIKAYISTLELATHSTSKHHIFINQRSIKNKMIANTIKENYGTLLDAHSYPFFIMFLNIPYELVNVNIHPRKEEVNFADNRSVLAAIQDAVVSTLSKSNLTVRDFRWKRSQSDLHTTRPTKNSNLRSGQTSSYTAQVLKEDIIPWNDYSKSQPEPITDTLQTHQLYIVTSTEKGILLVDQHAAHERILYEQLKECLKKHQQHDQQYKLPVPININLSLPDALLLSENINLFQQLGFTIKAEETSKFTISYAPSLLYDLDIRTIIQDILAELDAEKNIKHIDQQTHRILTFIACRSAIKAGDPLTKEQTIKLIEQLNATNNPYTCPHGRPTKIELTIKELNKMFKRS